MVPYLLSVFDSQFGLCLAEHVRFGLRDALCWPKLGTAPALSRLVGQLLLLTLVGQERSERLLKDVKKIGSISLSVCVTCYYSGLSDD